MKGLLTWRKSTVLAVMCMALLCVSVHSENAPQQNQTKVFNDAVGMIEKFLQSGRYIKIYGKDEGFGYILAANIQAVGIANNEFSIMIGFESEEFDLSEIGMSLDSESNLIIKPKE